ncbi:MAG: YdeI/OmpD-associated family protein [Deltaproteobacteria bacterium]|nr:YdeI/OmpD-associated family protein [Deltaproteobacteria bacterium]
MARTSSVRTAGSGSPARRGAGPKTYLARDRAAWRAWLEKHHETAGEIWLVYYKRHTGKASVTYGEALDEALCFGWIDGIVKRVDDERYMQRWTPRKNARGWSAVNLGHMRRLIAEGRVRPHGLRVLGVPLDGGSEAGNSRAETQRRRGGKDREKRAGTTEAQVPEFFERAIGREGAAAASFARLAPSHRRRYVAWILDAKREETRARRLAEAVRLLAAGLKELLK